MNLLDLQMEFLKLAYEATEKSKFTVDIDTSNRYKGFSVVVWGEVSKLILISSLIEIDQSYRIDTVRDMLQQIISGEFEPEAETIRF